MGGVPGMAKREYEKRAYERPVPGHCILILRTFEREVDQRSPTRRPHQNQR